MSVVTGTGTRNIWLLRAKLEAPRQQVALVDRPRLISTLDYALTRRLCLLTAPAGFGKTTLLAQWQMELRSRSIPAGWLTLDNDDREAQHFLAYIIYALDGSGVGMGRLLTLAEQEFPETSLQAIIAGILDAVYQHASQAVLILDDYHRAETDEINRILQQFIETGPDNLTIFVNSRTRPTRSITQSIASGRAMEIGPEALRFSELETRAAFTPDLSGGQADILFKRTEGWAMGIQLARLTAHTARDGDEALGSYRGQSTHLASYLAEQVLTQFPEDVQKFLLYTSICEHFSPPLANAIMERDDAWDMLRSLEPLRAFLVPLDQEWHRYHHLFADYLRDTLRRRYPAQRKLLHVRASKWFENEGMILDAVRHARFAEDFDRCAKLIEDAGGWELVMFAGPGALANLLRHIPEKIADRYPRIQVAHCYLALKRGQISEGRRYLSAAMSNPATLKAQAESHLGHQGLGRDLIGVTCLQEVYEDRWTSQETLNSIKNTLASLPRNDSLPKAVLISAAALNGLAVGDFIAAHDYAKEGHRIMRKTGSTHGTNFSYLHLGLTQQYLGQLKLSGTNFWEAHKMAEENFGIEALSDIFLQSNIFWQGNWTDENISQLKAALEHTKNHDGWFEVFATALDVQAHAAMYRADTGELGRAISNFEGIVEKRGGERLSHMITAYKVLHAIYNRDWAAAASLAQSLEPMFALGAWKDNPTLWAPIRL